MARYYTIVRDEIDSRACAGHELERGRRLVTEGEERDFESTLSGYRSLVRS